MSKRQPEVGIHGALKPAVSIGIVTIQHVVAVLARRNGRLDRLVALAKRPVSRRILRPVGELANVLQGGCDEIMYVVYKIKIKSNVGRAHEFPKQIFCQGDGSICSFNDGYPHSVFVHLVNYSANRRVIVGAPEKGAVIVKMRV
jgi:hypothetical protein